MSKEPSVQARERRGDAGGSAKDSFDDNVWSIGRGMICHWWRGIPCHASNWSIDNFSQLKISCNGFFSWNFHGMWFLFDFLCERIKKRCRDSEKIVWVRAKVMTSMLLAQKSHCSCCCWELRKCFACRNCIRKIVRHVNLSKMMTYTHTHTHKHKHRRIKRLRHRHRQRH